MSISGLYVALLAVWLILKRIIRAQSPGRRGDTRRNGDGLRVRSRFALWQWLSVCGTFEVLIKKLLTKGKL